MSLARRKRPRPVAAASSLRPRNVDPILDRTLGDLGTEIDRLASEAGVVVRVDSGDAAGPARRKLNLIAGANITLSIEDNYDTGEVDVTIQGESGADPWTYVKQAADLNAPSTTAVNSDLKFTPAASKLYVVEGYLLLKTDIAATGARAGVTWPTGTSGGSISFRSSSSTTTSDVVRFELAGTTAFVQPPGHPSTVGGWPCLVQATFRTGASPSGDFQITIQSEAGDVYLLADSWIRYREI